MDAEQEKDLLSTPVTAAQKRELRIVAAMKDMSMAQYTRQVLMAQLRIDRAALGIAEVQPAAAHAGAA